MPRTSSKKSRQSTLKRWKTFNEKEILESYFKLDNKWGRKTINYVKALVNLSEEQIYKWGYEKKRKMRLTSEAKITGSAQISRIGDNFLTNILDYNSIVSELFPEDEFNSEKLSREERARYDNLRDQMLQKDASIKSMSELDQILHERLPTDSICQKKTKGSRKSTLDESTFMGGMIREEEARKCQQDPAPALVRTSFEDSKICQAEEKFQAPSQTERVFEFLPMEDNLNFGEFQNDCFQESAFFKDDTLGSLFQL